MIRFVIFPSIMASVPSGIPPVVVAKLGFEVLRESGPVAAAG